MRDVESAQISDGAIPHDGPVPQPAPEGWREDSGRDLSAGTGDLLVRFIAGVIAEGTDEALIRLRQWNAYIQSQHEASAPIADEPRLRWLLLGFLLDTQTSVQDQVSQLRQRGARVLYHPQVTLRSVEESMREWLPRSLVRRVDAWRARGRSRREHWISEGYVAEREGRRLARYAAQATVEELLKYMAHHPQVRELIERQGVGVADEAVGEMRARAASADTRIEQITQAILHRVPSRPVASSGQGANGSHAHTNSGHTEKAK